MADPRVDDRAPSTSSAVSNPAISAEPTITLFRPDYGSVRLIQCSPPSWMVEITLREKGLPHRVKQLSFARGEHRTPEMLALNPRGTIPVLRDGDAVLWETLAILEYLDLAYPDPPLLGEDPVTRARALNKLHESGALKQTGMALFAYLMRTPAEQVDAERRDAALAALVSELDRWEEYYAQAPWAAGDALSLGDISVFAYVATSVHLGLDLDPAHPRLAAVHARMKARDSVRATWPQTWTEPAGVL